jgi:hypothetical protein
MRCRSCGRLNTISTLRHRTAHRIWQRILAARPGRKVAEVTIRQYVRERKEELGWSTRATCVPQAYKWGQEGEVDRYAEAWHRDRTGTPSTPRYSCARRTGSTTRSQLGSRTHRDAYILARDRIVLSWHIAAAPWPPAIASSSFTTALVAACGTQTHQCRFGNMRSGDDRVPKVFSTWAAIAYTAIGQLPDTWEDRSIKIQMQRRR